MVEASPAERLHTSAAFNPLFQVQWTCTGHTRSRGVNDCKRTLHLVRRHVAQDSFLCQDRHFILTVVCKTVISSSRIMAHYVASLCTRDPHADQIHKADCLACWLNRALSQVTSPNLSRFFTSTPQTPLHDAPVFPQTSPPQSVERTSRRRLKWT